MRTLRTLPLLALALAGCSDSTGPGNGATPARGLVVLNGSQSTGLTLRDFDGSDSTFVAFSPSTAFDGGSIAIANDTVLSTSSKAKGDQLWLATLGNGAVRRIQLPALSNPAGAAFVTRAEGRIAVALRDSQAVALVTTGASPVVSLIRAVGLCPADVAGYRSDVWVVDANANCRSDYAVQGAARLVRLRGGSSVRDTIPLPSGQRGSSASLLLDESVAYVVTGGVADFSNWPNTTFTTPGMVSRVDLTTQTVTASRALPAGTYGAGLKRGANGRLYVTAYTATDFSTQAVFAMDPTSLAFVGPFAAGAQSLALVREGAAQSCSGATADAQGNLYCMETDFAAAGATTIHVFGPTGTFQRSMAVGQYGADLAIR